MFKTFKKNPDLGTASELSLDWKPDNAEKSLQALYKHVFKLTGDAINWYITAKNRKRLYARGFRVLAILLGAAAALLPTLGELFPKGGETRFPAGWTAVLLGIVGALLLLDRFFGFSSGWMRFISTELELRQISHEFQMSWEAERASWQGEPPSADQTLTMIARCKALVTQVDTTVREETRAWVQEFESAIRQIDESAKTKTAIAEPGALNLTVTNGDLSEKGWKLSIDGGAPESYVGKTAGKPNLIPGRRKIAVDGEIAGKNVRAEKVINVPAGGTCDETLTMG